MLPKPRYDCPGEFHVVLFAVLVGDSSFGRVRADSFQSMMPSSDDLEGILEILVVIHLIL